jgi:hypothetical protein
MFTEIQKQVLYKKYLAIWESYKLDPEFFDAHTCCKELTQIFAGKETSWKVVGITPKALSVFAENDFKYKSGLGITRGHLIERNKTSSILLDRQTPATLEELFEIWFEADRTVLCAKGENRSVVPEYISIFNENFGLFPSKSVGWKHRTKIEGEFLKELAKSKNITTIIN